MIDHCDICNAPQWVMPNGEHRCMSIEELQDRYERDTELFAIQNHRIRELENELQALKESTDPRNRS